jgi:uncharacterized membrane protein YidH (DUF202 family)
MGNMKRFSVGIVLFLFLFAVAALPFFHTERTISESRNCPVCQFLQASIVVLVLTAVLVFRAVLLETIAVFNTPLCAAARLESRDCRAPPLS